MVPGRAVRRWRRLAPFLSGLVLWILSVIVTELTLNTNLIPTVVMLGSFLVPATAAIYYLDHGHSPTLTPQRAFFAFVYGGVVGILVCPQQATALCRGGSGWRGPPLAFASGLRRTAGISSWEAACWEVRPGPLNTSVT